MNTVINQVSFPNLPPLRGISSMATKALLAELCASYSTQTGQMVHIESVGGVDAAKRVANCAATGEQFDVVLLASDAIDRLIAAGHLQAGSRVDWVRSAVAVAIPENVAQDVAPDISTEAAFKAAVLAAPSISYSTGPSGTYLTQLFARWGMADIVNAKLVIPPPGVPVGSLLASGKVALGFQQMSELMNVDGVQVLGELPPEVAYVTTFSAGVGLNADSAAVGAFLAFLNAAENEGVKVRFGMSAA